MARRFGFKPTLRERQAQNLATEKFYAMAAPAEKMAEAAGRIAELTASIKPKRERAAPRQLEAPVVAAIAELLAVHPRVLFAVRQNSGAASYEAKTGRYAPVFFYRILTHNKELTLPDFWGILKDGRMFACEAKAPGWTMGNGRKHPPRVYQQFAFLSLVRNCGGVALFATSAQDVADALA